MSLAGRRYAVLVADGVEDLEFWVTVMRIQEEGATVVAVGSDSDPHRGKNGLKVQEEVTADAVAAEFDSCDDADRQVTVDGRVHSGLETADEENMTPPRIPTTPLSRAASWRMASCIC